VEIEQLVLARVEIEQLVLATSNLKYLSSNTKLTEKQFVILLPMPDRWKIIIHDINDLDDRYYPGYDIDDRFSDRFSDQMPLLEAWHFSQYQWYEFKTGQHPAMQKLDGYIRSL
jgi:hypothetical protein